MKVREVSTVLDAIAPPDRAADWDNVGLLVGDCQADVKKLMLCIDLTSAVLAEARRVKAQMIMAYHPVIFKPVSRVTSHSSPIIFEAIRAGIAVYSSHTALDVADGGTNDCLADLLDLRDRRPLQLDASEAYCKVVVFLPPNDLSGVGHAAFDAGAGTVGDYSDCSFFTHGIGTFCGGANTNPTIGKPGSSEAVEEVRLELIAPLGKIPEVLKAVRLAHSYEEPAIDVYRLENQFGSAGLGRVGRLPRPTRMSTLVNRIKKALDVPRVLQTTASGSPAKDMLVGTVAVAAGSCGDLWRSAVDAHAGLYLTGEMRHHDALAAAGAGMTVVCVGHSNSERITLRKLSERLMSETTKLKVVLSQEDRDPFEIV